MVRLRGPMRKPAESWEKLWCKEADMSSRDAWRMLRQKLLTVWLPVAAVMLASILSAQ